MAETPLEKKRRPSALPPDQLEPWDVFSRMEILLGQADTLQRLQRSKDRERKLAWGMAVTLDCQKAHPDSPLAPFSAAMIARATGQLEFASQLLSRARKLDHDRICGNRIDYEENLLKRERAVIDDSLAALGQRLIIYVCQRCGRPIEYISIPCMYCGWHPTTLDEMSQSVRLSRHNFSTWELLGIGRGIAGGRKATEVVTNLAEVAAEYMAKPESDFRKTVESMLHDAQQKQKDNYFSWHEAATCQRCGTFNFRQDVKECSKCGASLLLPPPLRLLICLSRLAIHFQHNFGGPHSNECDVFIRYIISLQSKLYRQQETPSNIERAKVLELMAKIGKFWTNKEYGYISMLDPQNITYELSSKLPEELKAQEVTALADFRDTLQFLANWMKRTKTLS
jgi:ribosomal protein L37E